MIKIRRKIPEAWYCGSLIQQNHGEANDKGVLIWEIQDKENFIIRPLHFKNPKPFVSVVLDKDARLPEIDVPSNSRLRLVVEHPITLKQLQDAKEEARWRWEPISIVHTDERAASSLSELEAIHYSQENLRDIKVQEELIFAHLRNYGQLEQELIERVFQINREVEKKVEYNEESFRNVKWTVDRFEWNNLFNYGEGNSIDFKNLGGLIGIFGKSYTGKSSVIDSMLFTIFNKTSKSSTNLINYINENKNSCSSQIEIKVANKNYSIKRSAKKKNKGTKASGDVSFSSGQDNLNGQSRTETDSNIRKIFGTVDDFLLTSMIPQFDALSFINEGSTKRKEILAKYLDLNIFDKKFEVAKDISDALRGAIKMSKDVDYEYKIKEAQNKKASMEMQSEYLQKQIDILKDELVGPESEVLKLKELQSNVDEDKLEKINIIDIADRIEDILVQINKQESNCSFVEAEIEALQKKIDEHELRIQSYSGLPTINKFIDLVNEMARKLSAAEGIEKQKLDSLQKSARLLDGIPCNSQFPNCSFISAGIASKKQLPDSERELKKIRNGLKKYNVLYDKLEDLRRPVLHMKSELRSWEGQLSRYLREYKKCNDNISHLRLTYEKFKKKQDFYENNSKQIEIAEKLEELEFKINSKKIEISQKEKKLKESLVQQGKLDGEVSFLMRQHDEYKNHLKEYEAYELYLKCMHSNGVAYDIIKQRLPILNEQIAKILDGIFDFTVRFIADEKKLNIFICHPGQQPRLVTCGSGAEQTIASIVITLALRMVSTLPQSDIFILDEPVGALHDELKMDFVKLLNYIKSQYRIVFLITHLESLKDVVDSELTIENTSDGARLVI